MVKKIAILGVTALTLAACGGDGVNEGELRDVINEVGARVCVPFELEVRDRLPNESLQASKLGETEVKFLKRLENGKRVNEKAIKQMEALVRAGLYKAEKEQRVGTGDKAARYVVYSLTERGVSEIEPILDKVTLCVGKRKVRKINYYTEPTSVDGLIVTNVSYIAKWQPEKWAGSLLKDYENNVHFEHMKQDEVRNIRLMKTNKGWRSVDELRD